MKQILSILAVAVGMAMSTAVFALGDTINNGSNHHNTDNSVTATGVNGNVTGGSATNSVGNASGFGSKTFSPEANSTNVNTAVGGQGGQGGKAEVKNSGNSFNANVNKNTNKQQQGQVQGQQQGQIGINKSTNKNINNNYDPNSAEVAQIQADAAVAVANIEAGASRDAANAAPQKLEIVTPGAVTVPNIYPTSPCMGSTSVGVGFMGGSVGGGTSWKDDDCSYRETARMFDQLGYKADGLTVMCESAYAKAAPSCKKIAAQAKAEADALAAVAAAQQVAAREPARTEEKRKTDATVRTSSRIVPEVQNYEQGVVTNAFTSDGQPVRSGVDLSVFPSSVAN